MLPPTTVDELYIGIAVWAMNVAERMRAVQAFLVQVVRSRSEVLRSG
jgi:hypothetical protein